jgi:5-methylcytosine-specific restriction protein A
MSVQPAPNSGDFDDALRRTLAEARARGLVTVDVTSGVLHRRVGGYPGHDHRMPLACRVMRMAMRTGDVIVSQPPKGQGATLTIRYRIDTRDRS